MNSAKARAGRAGPRGRDAIARLAFALLWALSTPAALAGSGVGPTIQVEPGSGPCVAPPTEMRRNHMQMLSHQRDRTLRLGERGAKVSLAGCVDCHASKESGSVIVREEDFCRSCHAYAAVKLDCFECHQSKARSKVAATTKTAEAAR